MEAEPNIEVRSERRQVSKCRFTGAGSRWRMAADRSWLRSSGRPTNHRDLHILPDWINTACRTGGATGFSKLWVVADATTSSPPG